MQRDVIVTINVVEPALVRAVNLLADEIGRPLHGLVLVDRAYADHHARPKDETSLFHEIICDFNNEDELQSVLKPYTDRLLAVTCRYEEAIQPFRKVIPFLPYLYTPTPESLLWSTEKPLMRDRLRNYDERLVPRYQYLQAEDLPQLQNLVQDFRYPVVIKPTGLSKALLVSRCDSYEILREKLDSTFAIIQDIYDRDRYPGKPAVLIEEMIAGAMFSVDAYVTHDGRVTCLPPVQVITAHSVGLPGFYGYERRLPTENLTAEEVQAAYATATSAIRALNLRSTTTHTEMYRTPEGWKVIEIAARIGGYREILYREVYGIEHFVNDLKIRMGEEPVIFDQPLRHAAVLNIYADSEGIIDSIAGIEQARQLPGVLHIAAHARPGDRAVFSTNGGDLIVDAIISHEAPDQLEDCIQQIRQLVSIKVQSVL